MKDELNIIEHRARWLNISNVSAFDAESRLIAKMRQIRIVPAAQVVDHAHLIPLLDEAVDHVTADESGTTRDYCDGLGHAA